MQPIEIIWFTHSTIIVSMSIKAREKQICSLSIITCVHCWDKWFYVWPNNILYQQFHNLSRSGEKSVEREREREHVTQMNFAYGLTREN